MKRAAGSHSASAGTELDRATKPWGRNLAHLSTKCSEGIKMFI